MKARVATTAIVLVLALGSLAGAQSQMPRPDQDEWLRLIRNDRLDLILPSAMRDNDIDMWIHGARQGNPDPLAYELGRIGGFIIFTDLGDRIERAVFGEVFGGGGAIENVDVFGSTEISRALTGYDHGDVDLSAYDELREYVESHDPERIAVNYSDWLAVADSISAARADLAVRQHSRGQSGGGNTVQHFQVAPGSASRSPSSSTRLRRRTGAAPSAVRTPISRVVLRFSLTAAKAPGPRRAPTSPNRRSRSR